MDFLFNIFFTIILAGMASLVVLGSIMMWVAGLKELRSWK